MLVSIGSDNPVRLLRPVGEPLGLYFRPGRNDHVVLAQAVIGGQDDFSGFVFDPCIEDRHTDLRETALERNLETVLDPRSVELSTEGGLTRSGVAELPWSLGEAEIHSPALLRARGDELVSALAAHVSEKKYSAVLAPTHIRLSARDEWGEIDRTLAEKLRIALDQAGAASVPIYYPLVSNGRVLGSWDERRRFKDQLVDLPVDALWMRVHPFGANAGPIALRRYIDAGRDFQSLQMPLVAERAGTAGLALMAFGAVGGIEGGITLGERFSYQDLKRKPKDDDGSGWSPQARVYISELGTFMKVKQAKEFFELRGMKSKFACRDTNCCRRGVSDMVKDPRPHFIRRRGGEVGAMSRLPEDLRAPTYLDEFLRPATDLAHAGAKAYPPLEKVRVRLDHWRTTLGALHRDRPAESFAIAPSGQRLRKSA